MKIELLEFLRSSNKNFIEYFLLLSHYNIIQKWEKFAGRGNVILKCFDLESSILPCQFFFEDDFCQFASELAIPLKEQMK